MTSVTSALVSVVSLRKAFGATQALQDCSLSIAGGEIRALLGENGSGKSTAVKILSGVLRPDAGTIRIAGEARSFRSPAEAQAAGIVTVFQETLVVPGLSVLDNIFLGTDGLLGWTRTRAAERSRAGELLAELGAADLDPAALVEALPLERRQIVTIARALARPWRLLILDEATSALDVSSRDALFRHLRRMRTADSAVLFISHRMDEIASVADAVTLLQSGETTGTLPVRDASAETLIARISQSRGGHVAATPSVVAAPAVPSAATGEAVIRAVGLALRPGTQPIDFTLTAGEIVGLSGLDGHGQAAFLAGLAGLRTPAAGYAEIRHDGDWRRVAGLRDAVRHGLCFVPRDRKTEGLFAGLSVLDNHALPTFQRWSRLSFIRYAGLRRSARADLAAMYTRYKALGDPVGRLSGGNQQKVLIARWLALGPRVLLLDDPLRGVDAATKAEMYAIFRALAGQGVAILFLSTEIEELLVACGKVMVFRELQLARTFNRSEMTRERIVAAMFGKTQPAGNWQAGAER